MELEGKYFFFIKSCIWKTEQKAKQKGERLLNININNNNKSTHDKVVLYIIMEHVQNGVVYSYKHLRFVVYHSIGSIRNIFQEVNLFTSPLIQNIAIIRTQVHHFYFLYPPNINIPVLFVMILEVFRKIFFW